MKKFNAKLAIRNNDRITIYNTGDRIEFYYNNSNRREKAICFYEIPFSLSVKKYFGCHGRTIGELYGFKAWYNKKLTNVVTTLFRELEFYSHLKRLTGDAPERRNAVATEQNLFGDETPEAVAATAAGETGGRDSSLATVENTPHTYHCVTDGADVDALAARLAAAAHFCFDTETTDLHVLHAELDGMSFAFEPHEAYYVPFPAERVGACALLEKFRPALENEKIEKTGHNIKYDLMVLGNYGVTLRGRLFDTMIAHYLLQPEMRHGMDYLSETLLSYEPIHIEELIGAKGKGQKSMRQVDVAAVADYAAEDADVTLQLRRVLEPLEALLGVPALQAPVVGQVLEVVRKLVLERLCELTLPALGRRGGKALLVKAQRGFRAEIGCDRLTFEHQALIGADVA